MPRPVPGLQMHTVVVQPLTATGTGRISCRPLGQEPIEFTWMSPDGRDLTLDSRGSEAVDLTPGRYRIEAVDAMGARADVTVDIEPMYSSAVIITGYKTTPTSTTLSRDGNVEVVGTGLKGHRFLWTNGIETDDAVLRDVPCGTYAAIPLSTNGSVPTLVHSVEPARVNVASRGRWGVG
jgi:hypothetical protein